MRVVAFVPAKGESSRIRNKNTVILDGEHLFKRKLRQLLECPDIDDVYLDTESDNLIKLASDLPIKILRRDSKLASNKTDGHALFANECTRVSADIYFKACAQVRLSPLTPSAVLSGRLKPGQVRTHWSLFRKKKQYTWAKGRPSYGEGAIPNSVDLPDTIVESMGL